MATRFSLTLSTDGETHTEVSGEYDPNSGGLRVTRLIGTGREGNPGRNLREGVHAGSSGADGRNQRGTLRSHGGVTWRISF